MKKFELTLHRRNIPKEDLLDDFKRVANLISQDTVTKIAYDQEGKFGANTFLRRFGSWNKALTAAGLKVIHTLNNKEEYLLENLANVWQHLGRQPVGKDLDKANGCSKFSLGTYEKRFGSWNKALQAFIVYINDSIEYKDEVVENRNREGKRKSTRRTPRRINLRLRMRVLVRDNCICKICGASRVKDPLVNLQVDHIKPWSKGGETDLENLQTLCSICNIGKSNL